jgi:hydrophobic/amphiphilic exporter-1 (mainly G- bacteria), HAE1 family
MNNAWTFFIRRRVLAWVLIAGIILTGLYSAVTLPKESFPEVEFPMAVVSTILPGASPTDTEDLLTKPIEKELGTVSGISRLQSSSGFSISSIVIEFEAGENLSEAVDRVKEAVDRAAPGLPDEAEDPYVMEIDFSEISVITYSLLSNNSLLDLSNTAEEVKKELETVSGVSKVTIAGNLKKEIHIKVNQAKLEAAHLSINDISNVIRFANFNLPAGAIEIDKSTYSIRFENDIENAQELGNIILGPNLLLKDIAKIETGTTSKQTISRISNKGEEPKNAISLSIMKKKGGNTIKIVKDLHNKLEELEENGLIPSDTEVIVSNDNAQFIKKDLNTLTKNGISTIFIIILILFLALGLREGLIAGLAIPLTFLISFSVLQFRGDTLNSLTLFSLVISLGLLVDTAIVMMEGIYEGINEGLSRTNAAIKSMKVFRWPLIAGTATTTFAFFPMLLVGGIMGEFMKTMPITISATLIASLFVSLFLIPTISTKFLKKGGGKPKQGLISPVVNIFKNIQKNLLTNLLYSRGKRMLLMLIITVAFLASMALPATGLLSTQMFSEYDSDYFIIDIETPTGTVIEETQKHVEKVENYLRKEPLIANFVTIIGSSQTQSLTNLADMGTGMTEGNIANITVNLVPSAERKLKSYDIATPIRDDLKTMIPEPKISVREVKDGPPVEAAIVVRITGADLKTLGNIAEETVDLVAGIEGTTEAKTDLEKGLDEFVFELDSDKLAYHGLSSMQVAGVIRSAIQGIDAGELTIDNEDVDILVRYENKEPNLTELQNIEIPSPKGYMVNLEQLGKYSLQESLSTINHENQNRMVKVLAEVKPGYNAVVLTELIEQELETLNVPTGYEISFGGDFEQVAESFGDLFMSMIIGVLLIAMTLVLQFNSIKQMVIILFTLPLAIIGVFPGLMLIGMALSFSAFIGVVALIGIVVNDAIVMISQINNNRKEGALSFEDSIIEAAYSRFQPVILTTLTTIFGVLPVALIDEMWGGVGYSLIFGLMAATVLTLIVIPVLYYMLERKKAMKQIHSAS